MTQEVLFGVGLGIETDLSSDIDGAGAPIGVSGVTDEANIGSTYRDVTNGDYYQKRMDTSNATDWVRFLRADEVAPGTVSFDGVTAITTIFMALVDDVRRADLKIDITPFPEDHYTSQGMHFRIWEIVREKLFNHTKEELPHSTFIWVEEIEDKPNILKIVAYVYTESESQKYIIIWKWWSLISLIWKQARIELEKVFDKKVFLALRAKSKKWWRKDEKLVKKILG